MEWHPYAKLFPLLGAEQLQSLADDIEANGLRQPIVIDSHERIIDGRNRHAACQLAGVKAVYEPFTGSDSEVLKLVISLNLQRRHLTDSQRAMVAAEIATIQPSANVYKNEHPSIEGPSIPVTTAQAAGMMSVSTTSVERARRVKRLGTPELAEAVVDGRVTVAKAAEIATLPKEEQVPAVADAIANPPRQAPRQIPSKSDDPHETSLSVPGQRPEVLGVGIQRAHEAIACLKKIPKADALRKRAFQVVSDWMKNNK